MINPELQAMLDRSREIVASMTPTELAVMHEAQKRSYLRSLEPCEHGIRDWETCPDCWEKHTP